MTQKYSIFYIKRLMGILNFELILIDTNLFFNDCKLRLFLFSLYIPWVFLFVNIYSLFWLTLFHFILDILYWDKKYYQ